ncbi:hypothetical protein HETIRDRAFT_171064 [Heterobasidion irregulare TC 32-1]|uniref:Uncharacterized protein n=1 Tax=Heterobasidion irregulare (strain TC 32-1) TaxID=747525 RepID=W4KHK3_HETIT|nr:uncharacterized protein HETIRDRAFT_171064 [Heterobasidion irregulare TC 32-1]ETW84561.1 hypothetical protein HETIRDRAFT_171064 [Heterobasidion irregulare TC 32-1]
MSTAAARHYVYPSNLAGLCGVGIPFLRLLSSRPTQSLLHPLTTILLVHHPGHRHTRTHSGHLSPP